MEVKPLHVYHHSCSHERERRKDTHRFYHGCFRCHDYSMMFAGMTVNESKITNKYEFESLKEEFVQHFNEEHADITRHEDVFGHYNSFTVKHIKGTSTSELIRHG